VSIKKYTDWRTWWDGLRTNLMKCIGTTGSAWLITNGISVSGIPGTSHMGVDWRSALGFFGAHLAKEMFDYWANNQPKVVVEETDSNPTAFTKPE
jgi:hypothetical protein